jgi:imidazolonepropionase-like amidohydrolase
MLHALIPVLALATSQAQELVPPGPVAIVHATVIDVKTGERLPDRTVLVQDGRITRVGPSGELEPPADARVVEAGGKFLVPGLWDMHVHFTGQDSMGLFLANGVTGVRVMWGNPAIGFPIGNYHFRWRDQVEAGTMLGPRMVVAGNILDGPRPIWPGSKALATPDEGREAVREAKAAGADFIKVYSLLPRDVYTAVAEESKAQGIPFAGHVPFSVSAREASDLGQRSLEHLYGVLASCSSEEDRILKERNEAMAALKRPPDLREVMSKFEQDVAGTYSADRAQDLFRTLARNRTWACPTLTVLRATARVSDPAFTADPRLKYAPPLVRLMWNPKSDFRLRALKPDDFARMERAFERAKELSGAMRRAGVMFLAGTDEMNPYCFPGFSLHDELALLVESGFTPLEALQTATINPALYLDREAQLGTVEPGKAADLLLLDADPLADIAHTKSISAVVARGRLLDRETLDRMLIEAERKASGGSAKGGPLPAGFCPDHGG